MKIAERKQAAAVRAAQRALWRTVVDRFRELELSSGLKQADLARSLGVSRPQIHEWLSDPRNMTVKAAGRLLLAMDAALTCAAEPGAAPAKEPLPAVMLIAIAPAAWAVRAAIELAPVLALG